jgi:glyoxylase-like metal-dependent hydrolase (beta-lactamase superfamily II)
MGIRIEVFRDPSTATFTYLVADRSGGVAAAIDPVLDYDPAAARVSTASADRLLAALEAAGLRLEWILETHAHADHLSAAGYLEERTGARVAIGEGIRHVQATFARILNLGGELRSDGSQFDHLFRDGESFRIGELDARVIATPGHTSDSVTYLIGDAAFVGDTLFMPDYGTARCDFPGGDARELYRSIRRLYALPPETRLFMCHDYPPAGREPRHETSVAAQRAANVHVRDGIDEATFVRMRRERDASLGKPQLLYPSIQINIRAGRLPDPESNSVRYLKLPLTGDFT